jgi:uncharacterized protein YkwD
VSIPARISTLVWGLVLLSVAATTGPFATAATTTRCRSLPCLVNGVRARHGLPVLKESTRLDRSARLRGLAIRRCAEFSHTACGQPFRAVFVRAGYRGHELGENLAWGSGRLGGGASTFAAWRASPDHRANLLDRSWRHVGVARIHAKRLFGASNVTVWVMQFGGRG